MAFTPREIQDILNEMVTDWQSRSELSVITNPSNADVLYNIMGIFAVEANILENLGLDLFNDIDQRALEIPPGTLKWHQEQTLIFQYGDTLTVIDGVPQYAVEDTSKQIVEYASATIQSGNVIIKAAKDSSGSPVPLSAAEKSALEQYWIDKRFSGTAITVVSQNGDIMRITARVEVDGQVIASDGQSQSSPGTYPVETAINSYLANLDFNGRFTIMELIDAMQEVTGVGNVVVNEVMAKQYGGSTYVNVSIDTAQAYTAVAGYITISTTPGETLRDLLTYVIV